MAEKHLTDGTTALAAQPRVIKIEAAEKSQNAQLRVAAYTRVSSDSDDQLNSFAAQNRHYSDLISSKENWRMVDIYADEGITGTSAEKREDFQRLLADCRRGLIDRVLVKSISRFARNTKECLETIRELKSLGVGVYFEKENIDTATMSGEMMTALFASFAQAESESISGNMRWGIQKRMQAGTYIPANLPYGYTLQDHSIRIVEEQAVIVQRIFKEYLSGKSTERIASDLREEGIPCKSGEVAWDSTAIRYIISNEKYIGDSVWQKYFSTDTLPYKCRLNRGQKVSYYAYGTHEGIVPKEDFEKANALMKSRAQKITLTKNSPYAFRKKIVCGDCQSLFRRKVVRGITYWVCIGHDKKRHGLKCGITPIAEDEITNAFIRLYYKLKHHGEPILMGMITSLQAIRNRRMLWSLDVIELNKQISDLTSQNQMLATLKQQGLIDPDIFIAQSNELTEQLRAVKLKKERLLAVDGDNTISQTRELMEILDDGPDFLDSFDAELFGELVETIIVESNERIRFRLKNGLELSETFHFGLVNFPFCFCWKYTHGVTIERTVR